MEQPLLQMKQITKRFGSVCALNQVNLTVGKGEIHALCGENGAGKSTLMNVLSGVYPHGSYEGDIFFNAAPCHFKTIKDSEKLGIVIIHQELALIPTLSIGENMFLGNERKRHGLVDWKRTNEDARKYMAMVGLLEDPHTLVKDIGMGKKQLLEIAKALAKNVQLLILDEPTSSLNESDAQNLLGLLQSLKKQQDMTSIIISHKLNEVNFVADMITIIRDGCTIETLDNRTGETTQERVIKGMVGREMEDRYPPRAPYRLPKGEPYALKVENWNAFHPLETRRKSVDSVSFHVGRGEVVGFAGMIGAGRTELAMSLFGKAYGSRISGIVEKDGQPLSLRDISTAIASGINYLPEDRKDAGLILHDSIKHNITLPAISRITKHHVIDKALEARMIEGYDRRLGVKCQSTEQPCAALSGGNQQKVLLGKCIFTQPDILILDEPTRGVDVGAKYEIYQTINRLASIKKSIIIISSEMPELLGMCDRIYVMCEGRIVAELTKEEATQEKIMEHIMQGSRKTNAS